MHEHSPELYELLEEVNEGLKNKMAIHARINEEMDAIRDRLYTLRGMIETERDREGRGGTMPLASDK